MSFRDIIFSSILIAVLVSIVQWLTALWIKTRLEKSVQHEYDKKLEDYRFSNLQRQKAEVIAQFFAKWIKFRGNEANFLDKTELFEYYEDLNRMSFEISLWIADDKILTDVMSRFQNKPEAKDIRELIGEFRKLILGLGSDEFNSQNIVLWPTSKELFESKK